MAEQGIRFEDGASYEQMMGVWSRLAGEVFLDWLGPAPGQRWIDIGCGNGAFTELLIARCAPREVQGVDPSEAQLAYARTRAGCAMAAFQAGDAMALPFPERRFDAAVMALVVVFVPDPAKGIAEMARVVGPGGLVATYVWDMVNGGFPLDPILGEMRAMGLSPPQPPQVGACLPDALRGLWADAGLEAVAEREITVRRSFPDFDTFWAINTRSAMIARTVAAMAPGEAERLKQLVRERVRPDAAGAVTYAARANAIRGRVAG